MFSLQKKIFRLLCGVILSKIRPAIYSQEKCCLLLDTQAQEKVHTSNVSTVEEAYAIILESYRTYYELLKEGGFQVADVLPTGVIEIV